MSEHYCTYKDGMCELDVDEAYTGGYQQGRADREKELSELPNEYSEKLWRIAYQKGKTDGAREFLAWYAGGETMPSFGRYAKCNIDDVIAEWQKGADNE